MSETTIKLSVAQRKLYDDVCRLGHDRVVAGYKPAAKLAEFGLVTIKEEYGNWTLKIPSPTTQTEE